MQGCKLYRPASLTNGLHPKNVSPFVYIVRPLECPVFTSSTNWEARVIVGVSPPRSGALQVSKHESKHASDTEHICVALDKFYGSVKASILTPPPILQKVANDNIRRQRLESMVDNCRISRSPQNSTVVSAKQPSRQHGRTDSQLMNSVVQLGSGRVADVRLTPRGRRVKSTVFFTLMC